MISFKKIILHNFGSYAHAELDLKNRGFCLVSGRNHYMADNAYSNGSGKSFIWNGICFALTGETLTGVHSGLKNLLIDEDSCYVTLFFNANGEEFELTRFIAPKSDLHIIKDGVNISGKGIRESEKKLGEVLPDLSKDLLTSTIIIGQGMPNAFSKLSPSGRKELLEKLTKSDFMIEDIKERVLNVSTDLNTKLRTAEDAVLVLNTKLDSCQKLILELNSKLASLIKPDFAIEIEKNEQLIATSTKQVTDLTAEQEQIKLQLLKIKADYEQANELKLGQIKAIQDDYNQAVAEGFEIKAKVKTEVNSLQETIDKGKNIKEFCPVCGQKLIGVTKPDLTAVEKELDTKKKKLEHLEEEFTRLKTVLDDSIKKINNDFDKTLIDLTTQGNEKAGQLSTLGTQILGLKNTISTTEYKIAQLKQEESTFDKQKFDMQTSLASADLEKDRLLTEIADKEVTKVELNDKIATLKKVDSIVKRDLRGYLLINIVNYINAKAKEFCKTVYGTEDILVALDGNALEITYRDKSFDNLSGGEKTRIDLILQLAIRDMLRAYLNYNANILVLDEVTDFLDKQSSEAIMNLIEKELVNIESVFIISHHADELAIPIDSELKIVKSADGISSIS